MGIQSAKQIRLGIVRDLLLTLALLTPLAAKAAPTTYALDYGLMTGSFVYDRDTGFLSSVSIREYYAGYPPGHPESSIYATWTNPLGSNYDVGSLYAYYFSDPFYTYSNIWSHPITSPYSRHLTNTSDSFEFTDTTSFSYGGDTIVASLDFSAYFPSNGFRAMASFDGYTPAGAWDGASIGEQYGGFSPISTAPVPEPETYATMLAGLGLLGFIARRRKQKGSRLV